MIKWEELTEAQKYAFKEYGNGKRCYEFTSEAIGSLAYAGYFALVQDDLSDSAWYRITDKGRAVLAQQPEADSGDAVDVIEYQRSIRNLRDAVIELRSEMHEVACALRYGEITPQAAAERLESALNG